VGVAQVGLILMLTVVGLPCAFFTLLALLDRFERSLSPHQVPEHAVAATLPVDTVAVDTVAVDTVAVAVEPVAIEATADVVSLPMHLEHATDKRGLNESSAAAV
jgi:multisubunit Na+/H+ antiporter MnhB subunit